MVPAPLKSRGVVVMLHPERIRAKQGIEASAELGLGGDGQLVVRIPGGLLGGARFLEIERGELSVTRSPEGLVLAGGPITELVVRADPASAVHRTWTERAPFGLGPDWTLVGSGSISVLTLDPTDPRKPPRASLLGRARATATVWRRTDGALRLDAVGDVIELLPEGIHAIGSAQKATVIHAFRSGIEGWRVGYRLNLGDVALPASGTPPDAIVAGRFAGRVGGEPLEAALAVRSGGVLHLFDQESALLASAPLATARFTTEPRLLVLGPQLDLVADLPSDLGRWLVEGTPEDAELLEIERAPAATGSLPGAARARLHDGFVTLSGTRDDRIAIAELDPSALVVEHDPLERDGETARLALGAVVVRGRADAIARLRESVLAQGGRAALARAELPELLAIRRTLREDRWLWLLYGTVFAVDRLLAEPSGEAADETDRPGRRRWAIDALVVVEHAPMVRLRLGLAPVALPYLLADEEAAGSGRPPVEPFRAHLRAVGANLEPALAEVERVVAGLAGIAGDALGEPPSLGPAPTLLPPGAVRKLLDQSYRDLSARGALERFGPQCRMSWALLTEVAAVSARETAEWLAAWIVERESGGEPPARNVVTDQILALRAWRSKPLAAISGVAIGDVIDRIRFSFENGVDGLVERLVGST